MTPAEEWDLFHAHQQALAALRTIFGRLIMAERSEKTDECAELHADLLKAAIRGLNPTPMVGDTVKPD